MRVLSVVGARPQFIKVAPMATAFESAGVTHTIVHTGQHYDAAMSDMFFADLAIPTPAVNLGIGSGTHGVQTGAMLAALEPVFTEYAPDWVLVYGDTNSTLAAAVSAVKLHIPVAHLEAGLRSFNRRMPEEHNRVLTDHAADLLLAPTANAMAALDSEGLRDRSLLVGDVMADVCLRVSAAVLADRPTLHPAVGLDTRYVVATVHRADNTDDPKRLADIVNALRAVPERVLLVAHPRLVSRAAQFGIHLGGGSVTVVSPMGYLDMIATLMGSAGVITDSGGLQKEAFLLGTPCMTLRTETEWPETLDDGWNILDPELRQVAALAARHAPDRPRAQPFGDGRAAQAVVAALRDAR